MKHCLALAAALLSASFTAYASHSGGNDLDERTAQESKIARVFADYEGSDEPGVAVLVAIDGKTIFSRGYGVANVSSGSRITPQTQFNVGSVSKQFTLFAILLLQDKGLLSLTDDVRKFIPELHEFDQPITLEQLARHTSGYKSINYLQNLAGWRQPDLRTHDQNLRLIARQRHLDFGPGSNYRYSNTGTALLAEVVARVYGRSFASFMEEEVFQPLDMNRTFVRESHSVPILNETHSYYRENGILQVAINPVAAIGYTNVYSTVEDLAKWAHNFDEPIVGSAEIIEIMDSPTDLPDGRSVEHRMGRFLTPYRGIDQLQHTGSHRAFLAYLGQFPSNGLTIVLLSNIEGFELFGRAYQVADVFLPEGLAENGSQTDLPAKVDVPTDTLRRYEGHYWNDEHKILREIRFDGEDLLYVRSEQDLSRLRPISTNQFALEGSGAGVLVRFMDGYFAFSQDGVEDSFAAVQLRSYSPEELDKFQGIYYSDELNQAISISSCTKHLVVEFPKRSPIDFSTLFENTFASDAWYMNTLQFNRHPGSDHLWLRASNVGVSDVRFERLAPTPNGESGCVEGQDRAP